MTRTIQFSSNILEPWETISMIADQKLLIVLLVNFVVKQNKLDIFILCHNFFSRINVFSDKNFFCYFTEVFDIKLLFFEIWEITLTSVPLSFLRWILKLD